MSSIINTNLSSLTAQRNSGRTQNELATAIGRLSSGLRINSARDDAAGLAIADRFTSQIRGTQQAARNANDGISLAQTAEGSLGSVTENLQRMRELAVQSANGTNSSADRAALQREVAQLAAEIDRVAMHTQFNGIHLLDGSFIAQSFHVGANAEQTITIDSLGSARSAALGQYQGVLLTNQSVGSASNTPQALSLTIGSGATLALGSVAVDGRSIVAAINSANVPGLTATVNATYAPPGSSGSAGTNVSGTAILYVNGTGINLTGTDSFAALASNRDVAVAAINAQSAVTGVTATLIGDGVSLGAADGRNIYTSYDANTIPGTTGGIFGLTIPVLAQAATIEISYTAPKGTTGNVVFAQSTGLNTSTAIGGVGQGVSAADISTVSGATLAMATLDRALAAISSSRASLGAVQNRFFSALQNLQMTGDNLSASRSRIQDADFAAETANLTRSQILQEAGTAMTLQANQLPQQVLELLR